MDKHEDKEKENKNCSDSANPRTESRVQRTMTEPYAEVGAIDDPSSWAGWAGRAQRQCDRALPFGRGPLIRKSQQSPWVIEICRYTRKQKQGTTKRFPIETVQKTLE